MYLIWTKLAIVVSAFFFFFFFFFFVCHSLSLPVGVFVSLIPFHCFTTETISSTKGHNLSIIISCTRLYTFEKKGENDRKGRVWRQTKYGHTKTLTPQVIVTVICLIQTPKKKNDTTSDCNGHLSNRNIQKH